MKKQFFLTSACVSLFFFTLISQVDPCTSLLVTKGASENGAVMITYTCDGEFHSHLEYTPATDHQARGFS